MPIPIAHPAAVLPLRRYCPSWLSFPALVAGSVSPDLAYLFGPLKVDDFAHGWRTSLVFSLPAGLLLVWAYEVLRSRVVLTPGSRLEPNSAGRAVVCPPRRAQDGPPYQESSLALPGAVEQPGHQPVPLTEAPRPCVSRRRIRHLLELLLSIALGVLTHLVWDSFTHKGGWVVDHVPLLQATVMTAGRRSLRVFHLFWYASSFGGVAWLCFAWQKWRATHGVLAASEPRMLWNGLVVGALVLPIGAVHHLVHNPLGVYAAAALLVLLVWALWRMSGLNQPPRATSA